MRAVEQDRILSTGLGVWSEGSFQEETPLDLHFPPPSQINVSGQQGQITASSLQKQGYTTTLWMGNAELKLEEEQRRKQLG